MPAPPTTMDPDATGLFLDVDGTLLEICDTPSAVVADPDLLALLRDCHAVLDGAMCLVSGRSIAELDRIMMPARYPAAGAHGAEVRIAEAYVPDEAATSFPAAAQEALQAFVARHEGLLLEQKRGGVSLHFRKAPALEPECRAVVSAVLAELGNGFRLIAGKMVFELAPAAHNKGTAIRRISGEPPFAGRTPVFIGDDVTDEDGFDTVNRLGGMTVRVGGNDASMARFALHDVAAVRHWLRDTLLKERVT